MRPGPSPRILVVDDDEGLGRLIARTLEREGYGVARALSGAEAIQWLSTATADLLLLDLKLEDMGAKDIIHQLNEAGVTVPYIIITGQGDERVAVDMMKQGALDYLVKDADFLTFLPAILGRTFNRLEKESRLAQAEEALRRENALTSAVLEACGALIIVLDPQGRVIRFNRAAEEVTGRAASEVVGQSFFDHFFWPEDLDLVRASFERLLGGEAQRKLTTALRTRSGERRIIAWSNAVLPSDRNPVDYVVATGIDITEGRRLENEILQVSERERRRIGHDLHDGLGQHLTGIEFMSEVLAQRLGAARSKEARSAAERAAQVTQHVRQAIVQTRMLARGLAPIVLDSEGLMAALKQLASNTEQMVRISCQFECASPVIITDQVVAMHLYRIAQEAVSNAARHGKARQIIIQLESAKGYVTLTVRDNGVGMTKNIDESKGMGLRIMQYRAGMIGGSLSIQPEPAGGTRVSCVLHPPADFATPSP